MFSKLIGEMVEWERGCPGRVQHLLKVVAFSEQLANSEGLDDRTKEVLRVAAAVHDIGIKLALEKYGSSAGHYQEIEGPAIAEKILRALGYDEELIARVSYLVGHHHSYDNIEGDDYQILVEADFLVNIYEGSYAQDKIIGIRNEIFKTKSGSYLLELMYL